jgi:hypothetical protein
MHSKLEGHLVYGFRSKEMFVLIAVLWLVFMQIDAILKNEGISLIGNLTLTAFVTLVLAAVLVLVWQRR